MEKATNNNFYLNNFANNTTDIDYLALNSGNTFHSNYFSTVNYTSVLSAASGIQSNQLVPYRLSEIGIYQEDTSPSDIPTFTTINTNDGTSVNLTWSPVSEAAGYKIYRTENTDSWTNIAVLHSNIGNATSWGEAGLSAATNYYYYITSYDTNTPHDNESWFSDSSSTAPSTAVAAASNITRGISYTSIQTAVDAATNGETIVVFNGTYTSAVTINELTNFSLISWDWITNTNAGGVEFDGGDSVNRLIIISNSPGTTIQGFTVHNAAIAGIYICSGSINYKIFNNIVYSNAANGIQPKDLTSGNSIIASNTIYGPGQITGIRCDNADFVSIYSNNIYSVNRGLYLSYAKNCLIDNNIFDGNNWRGIDIQQTGSSNNTILSNTFSGNTCDYGILIWDSAKSNTIKYNTFSDLERGALRLSNYGANNLIEHNLILGTPEGLVLEQSESDLTITKNTFTNLTSYGLTISGITNAVISLNNFEHMPTAISNIEGTNNTFLSNYFGSINLTEILNTNYNLTDTNLFTPYRFNHIDIHPADLVTPSTPSCTAVTNTVSTISIYWQTNTEAAGYRIYRSTVGTWTNFDTYTTNIAGSHISSWTDDTAGINTNYYYFITAYDTNSPYENESWWSASTNAQTSHEVLTIRLFNQQ
jgi:parallel beta-helix repeat protein